MDRLKYGSEAEKTLVDAPDNGFYKRYDSSAHNEVYLERPIMRDEYKIRPMSRGFYDEAFDLDGQAMIVPKALAGYNGHRWPNTDKNAQHNEYIEGSVDKVWLPSTTELNVAEGKDWNNLDGDAWSVAGDEVSSTVFEYCKNFASYKNPLKEKAGNNTSVAEAIYSRRTELAKNGRAGNYSIPLIKRARRIF